MRTDADAGRADAGRADAVSTGAALGAGDAVGIGTVVGATCTATVTSQTSVGGNFDYNWDSEDSVTLRTKTSARSR